MIRMCKVCRAAENPKSKLAFHETLEGVFCDTHNPMQQSPLKVQPETGGALTVIQCPVCGGSGRQAAECSTCIGYGSVRVQLNAIPVFRPKPISGPSLATKKEPGAEAPSPTEVRA